MKASAFASYAILAGVAAAELRLRLLRPSLRESSLHRREATAGITVDSLRYLVNVTIGTPPQELSLHLTLDAGGSWVPDEEECDFGCEGGAFDSTASSTFDDDDYGYFSVAYGDGSSVYGYEFTDTIRVGDTEIEGLTMGLVTNDPGGGGVLAIGPSAQANDSIIEKLIQDSVIHSAAYSVWLDDADGDSGTLLFGAVDTSAFEAPLQRISTRPAESAYSGFPVEFSVLDYIESPGADHEVIAPQNDLPLVLVRPTDVFTNLPSSIAKKIWHHAGATYDESLGLATIPCSGASNPDAELLLGLGIRGNATARVSFKDLVIHYGMGPEGDICAFGIVSSSSTGDLSNEDGPWSLGGAVLRNTYIAFDLVNDEVALAPVRSGGSGSRTGEVVPFPSYGAEIPRSEDADPISDREYGGGSRYGGSSGIGALGFILVIVGAVLVVVVTITCVFFCWYRGYCCWKGRRKDKTPEAPPPQSGPISEKVLYAGAVPPALPPRPVRAGLVGLSPEVLPLGCAWVSQPEPHAMPVAPAPPPTENREGPSGAQRAAPAANPVEGGDTEDQPARGSVESTATPPARPSTRSPSPAGSRTVEDTATPAVAGPSNSEAKDDPAKAPRIKDTPEATP